MSQTALREEIAHELSLRIRRLRPDAVFDGSHPHRLRDAADNLVPGVPYGLVREDLLECEGRPQDGTPIFDELCDIASDVALAVNTFGPFRAAPRNLQLPGLSGFTVLRLGKRLRTGLGGAPSRLGALAIGDEAILGVTCVLAGMLARKTATLAPSCSRAVAELASPEWSRLYDSLCDDPSRFRSLDAAALLRQYLAMVSALSDEPQPKTMLYVFWEPTDWPSVPAFAAHRSELLRFSLEVAGSDVSFVSMSCTELWDLMEEGPAWPGRLEWLDSLRARYVL